MIVRQIENNPTATGDVPVQPVVIADCGALSADDPSLTRKESSDGDIYEDYPDDEDQELGNPETVLQIAKVVREVGNALFKKGDFNGALQKYQSRFTCAFVYWEVSHVCLQRLYVTSMCIKNFQKTLLQGRKKPIRRCCASCF